MYSAYLVLAFIFGRTLVVQASVVTTLTLTVADPANDITTTSIKMTAADGDSSTTGDYKINRYTDAAASQNLQEVGTTMGEFTDGTGLSSGTPYYYQIVKTATDTTVTKSKVYGFTTVEEITTVTVEKVESTSATFKWGSFTTYKDTSVKVDSGDKKDLATETYVLEELKPSTKSAVLFQGFKNEDSNGVEQSIDICTAPSKPTITNKIESTTANPPVNTLTLTIKFSTGDKVFEMDFETGVELAEVPTCSTCDTATLDQTKKKFTFKPQSTATDGPEFTVVFGNYPEANTESDIKVKAKFGDCTGDNTVGVMETTMNSVATLANKQAMLVYLAIGTMATVLRLLGMEVWTPIGLL